MEERQELSEYYIGRTDAYFDEEQDWIFTPALFVVTNNPKKHISAQSDIYQLTEKGNDFFDDWADKYGTGYDLCNGRMGTKLQPENVYNILTTNPEYSVKLNAEEK